MPLPVQEKITLPHEEVPCALCGGHRTRVKYRIALRDSQLSTVWLDGVPYRPDGVETVVICLECGLVYVNPRLAERAGISTYTEAQEAAYFRHTRAARLAAYAALVRQLPRWLGRRPRTLLDVGCGDGVLVEVARRQGIQSLGVEISRSLVQQVQARLGTDAATMAPLDELPEAHYDVVALLNVIEHLRDPAGMLYACRRRLRPGGLLLVHTPNLGGLPARLQGAKWHHLEPLEHFYYFTPRTLKRMLVKTGFRPLRRFQLVTATGGRAVLQRWLGRLGVYVDNGLGVVATLS